MKVAGRRAESERTAARRLAQGDGLARKILAHRHADVDADVMEDDNVPRAEAGQQAGHPVRGGRSRSEAREACWA